MKKLLKGTLTGLLLVTLATPGFAENRKGSINLSPFVGGYLLDKEQHEESRPEFGLRAGYNVTENLGLEAMFGYSLTETKYKYGSRETDMYRYGVDILYHFMPQNNLVPFVVLGGGGTNFNIPSSPSSKSHYAGTVSYGAGLKYFVAPDVALRGDARHAILVQDTGDNNLEYTFGLTFQFGGERKAVTAIPPAVECPANETVAAVSLVQDTTPPTVTFTSPVKGDKNAPVNQKVSAAFSENMDQSTISAATFSVSQGSTPVSGKVTSGASTATFTPENNFEKGKEYTATVTTGAKDLAGNLMAHDYRWNFTAYQTAPAIAVMATLDNSNFDFDSANISENGKTILNGNITTLKDNQNIKIRIAGYTSASGSEEYNQELSERRAKAVKEYLVKIGGINPNRLSTIGYGKSNPAKYEANPSDKLSAAALANMRVVVEIIEE